MSSSQPRPPAATAGSPGTALVVAPDAPPRPAPWLARRRRDALARARSLDARLDVCGAARDAPAAAPAVHDDPRSPIAPPAPARPPRSPLRAPLPSIPASNPPSRPPSPVARAPRALPPLSFRPTAANRPGSAAGFRPPPVARTRSATAAATLERRPSTSERRPSASGSEAFLRDSLSVYGISAPSFGSTISLSLAPLPSPSTPVSPPKPQPPPPPPPAPRPRAASEARAAARLRGFVLKGGKRHHPRAPEDAPYPRNYDRKVLDHDVWENAFVRQLAAASPTFHAFPRPPARVLDLGCGTGAWILDCARDWPDSHFVGLDLVPIQPDPRPLGLAPRVRWVHANFLQPLPFPDASFSFVHLCRVARGVPEDRWGPLFEELARVLQPGGALEVVEEDLFFPGSVWVGGPDDDDHDMLPLLSHTPAHTPANDARQPAPAAPAPAPAEPRPSFDSRSSSSSASDDDDDDDAPSLFHVPHTDPRDHSLLERAYTDMHAARFINLTPLAVLHSSLVLYFRNVRSHAALQLAFPPPPSAPAAPPAPAHLLRRADQPYITLDRSLLSTTAAPLLPPPGTAFDLAALNLHLSARVAEVLACAEEMWAHLRAHGPPVARDEWDDCLARFEMDMQDKIGLSAALRERLAWRVRATPRTPERKAFDDAVRRWERAQRRAGADPAPRRAGVPLSRRLRAFVARKDG